MRASFPAIMELQTRLRDGLKILLQVPPIEAYDIDIDDGSLRDVTEYLTPQLLRRSDW